jgi:phosphoenolpyruvate mutase
MTSVYIGMTADVLHPGLINIITEGCRYGDVTIGLLTDAAVADHKRIPFMTWDQRYQVLRHVVGVSRIVEQSEWSYAPNVRKLQPDYLLHGDDWDSGELASVRAETLEALREYGGRLVEVGYTQGISSGAIALDAIRMASTPEIRRAALRRSLEAKSISRFLETHNPLSALIVEHAAVASEGKTKSFDGFWSSSLTDSTSMGKPDIEALDMSTRLSNINSIFEVTTKPLIMDADTGGKAEHFEMNVRSMARLGISAVIIEDKTGLKRNSLLGNEVVQTQASVEDFCHKIAVGRSAVQDPAFMIIARIESLILDKGQRDASERADAYVAAGAHGIMIHSRHRQPDEILEFADAFRARHSLIPLISVPSSYSQVKEKQLADAGFNIVIYANHLLRAAYPAMKNTAESILRAERSLEAEEGLMSINDILSLIPGTTR